MKKNIFLIVFLLITSLSSMFAQTNAEVVSLTKADFLSKVYNYEKNPDKWVYEGTKPCIIDFYADWCGPCRTLAPVLAEMAAKYKDKIIVYKINVDKEKELAKAFGISSIPTLLFIPTGENPQMAKGAMSKEILDDKINKILLK